MLLQMFALKIINILFNLHCLYEYKFKKLANNERKYKKPKIKQIL